MMGKKGVQSFEQKNTSLFMKMKEVQLYDNNITHSAMIQKNNELQSLELSPFWETTDKPQLFDQ